MALTSITVTTGAVVEGRALARNGQVSLDNDTFTTPGCATTPATPPPTTGSTGPGGDGPGSGTPNSASRSPELPVTGTSPLSGELLGLSALLLVLGGLFLTLGRSRTQPRRQH
jgi:hypothetical protein